MNLSIRLLLCAGLVSIGIIANQAELLAQEPATGRDSVVVVETEDLVVEPREAGDEQESDSEASREEVVMVPKVDVIGERVEQIDSVPGSASVVTERDIERQRPISGGEVLREVPGVHVSTEDPLNLRLNIGMRGLDPTRSRNVLILEDGVPVSLAPYGEPEMYYTPPIERMRRIEVVKGSGSILFGPQTIGGVVNYITPDPPRDFQVNAEARAGTFGYYTGQLNVGDTHEGVGWWINALHQRYDGPRALELTRSDITGKFNMRLSPSQSLGLKINYYDEDSAATYLGLTTPQFEADPRGSYAKHDDFDVRRYALAVTHTALPTDTLLLETRLYAHNVKRFWQRQDFDREPAEGGEYQRVIDGRGREVTGEPRDTWASDGSSVFFRDSTGNRNREFDVAGLEPRATIDWRLGQVENELHVGARLHYERVHDQRINGEHRASPTGLIRDDEERSGLALAGYALNRFMLFDRALQISPGVRYESFWSDREILRTRQQDDAGNRVPIDLDPSRAESTHVGALIPGAGVSFSVTEPLTFFGGVHRGFAPPRTKDAITSEGENLELEAEYSWNYELGARVRLQEWLSSEITGFWLDFENQIIAPAEAGGAVANDPEMLGRALVNGGETTHLGVESALRFDPAELLGWGVGLPIGGSYTFVHAEFDQGWNQELSGNRLPYAPKHRATGWVGIEHPVGANMRLSAHYVSEQFSDKLETVEASTDGLVGRIDSYWLLDAQISYTHQPSGLTCFVTGKNLLDQTYIASRAPRGIKPGAPLTVFAGLRLQL